MLKYAYVISVSFASVFLFELQENEDYELGFTYPVSKVFYLQLI